MTMPRPAEDTARLLSDAEQLPPEDRAPGDVRGTLDDIYRRQKPRLLRFFSRRAGNDDADDLVQEAFARYAIRSEAPASNIAEPEAYLTTVAVNLLRDRAKFAVRRASAFHQVFDDTAVGGVDPIGQLEDRDLLRRLDSVVLRLKPRARQVFLLQRVEGMTYGQIAECTGMSVKAVKKLMAKALFQLRRDVGSI